jgi:hypothetical protein
MTPKERFLKTLKFEPVDRMFNMEIGLWEQTAERWKSEGAPADLDWCLLNGKSCFQLDIWGGFTTGFDQPINPCEPMPPFEEKVLEEKDDHILFTDTMGRTRMARKSGTVGGTRMSMDHYIDFPIKTRKDFLALRKRYEGNPDERYSKDWDAYVERVNGSDAPVVGPCTMFGYYSMLRNWIGTERLSYMFYDDPSLIHECLDFLSDYILKVYARVVGKVHYDFTVIHEDLAGKGGPLIGPKLFREFILPHYKRHTEFLRSKIGLKLISVDTDGDFESLIPLFLEGGVDAFAPMEVAAGMDPVVMRKKYGRSFVMWGGVDKREIAKDKHAIDACLARLAPVVHEGGYIPCIDHTVPPDISYANYQYYLERKRVLIGA